MSTDATGHAMNGNGSAVAQPRARKPWTALGSPALSDETPDVISPPLTPSLSRLSGVSSGHSTPVPSDAPPSVQATVSARKQIRAQQKARIFPSIEYAARLSHFDPDSDHRDFRGFFVLFWIGLAIMVITAMLRNYREKGSLLLISQWHLFTENIYELAASDLLMAASTYLCLPLHKLYANSNGFLRWNKAGMYIQTALQMIWLAYWVTWPFVRNWTWTAQVFFTLHLMSLFMKLHSYAFYNGHLAETRSRLKQLDKPEGKSRAAVEKYPTFRSNVQETTEEAQEDERPSAQPRKKSDHSPKALAQLREDLAFELTSPLGRVTYPQNLTLGNFTDFLFCPTLCYELEYPRMEKIRLHELFYKSLAVLGCVFLMTVTSEEFILPVLRESALRMHLPTATTAERCLILAETISRMLFPFMVTFLLVFLSIFEYLLGFFAELTRFADRHFYASWWNSTDWLMFSREWNIPVHHFFRRHVYAASKNHMSRPLATALTFLISALAHELIMGCISKKFRGYGFIMMMLQMPIVLVQRSKYVRGRTLLNNVLFWCSMILGLSMICALYVLV